MKLNNAISEFNKILKENNIADYKNNTAQIFLYVLNCDKVHYLLQEEISEEEYLKAKELVLKRAKHYPLQYLISYVEFLGNKIFVDENVLIPRNETEQLCDIISKKANNKSVLDLCCGSGCIGLGIKRNSNAKVTLSDVSIGAINVAKKNAEQNNLNVNFVLGNLFENVKEKFDIIVSNPPYIETKDLSSLQPEVQFEPKLALDGKTDGYYFYEKIIDEAPNFLNENGEIYFEFGIGQAENIKNLLSKNFDCIKIIKDYYDIERFVYAKLKDRKC